MNLMTIFFPWTRHPRISPRAITPLDVEPAAGDIDKQQAADAGRNQIVQNIILAGQALSAAQNRFAAQAARELRGD